MKATAARSSVPRVAVIGAGYWGKNLVRNFHALGALAAVCDASAETLKKLQAEYPACRTGASADEFFADPAIDAVAIAAPAEQHYELARKALEAGKDVFVEKPLSLKAADGQALIDLAQQKKRILMVGHILWYHPAVLKLKEMIDAGELGRIQYVYSNRLNIGKIRREENILWSFAPHDVSVILGLLDELPDQVWTHGGNYLHSRIADVTVSALSFPSGVRAHIFVSWLHPFKEQKLVVVGDKKMAVFDDVEKEAKLKLYPHSITWKDHVPVASKADAVVVPVEAGEPLKAECGHFLECIATRATPRTDGNEGLRVLRVLQLCEESLHAPAAGGPAKAAPATAVAPTEYKAHETAVIDDGVQIGKGTAVWHFSHVLKGTKIGKDCRIGQNVVIGPNAVVGNGVKIQNNVSVYEGVTLEDNVFCGPSMVFTNVFNPRSAIPRMNELRPTLVKRGATLGANCTVVCGHTIGEYAFVGAGSVVTKDVPPYALMVGVPARITGWMCECGLKLAFKGNKARCACGMTYKRSPAGVAPVRNPTDIRKARGLGKDLWRSIGADEYVKKERKEWR